MRGILTGRDIVVRALAADRDPATTTVEEVATRDPVTVRPDQPAAEAVALMRDHALRRLPVCEDGHAVGVVSLGDLATARDRRIGARRHQRRTRGPLTDRSTTITMNR